MRCQCFVALKAYQSLRRYGLWHLCDSVPQTIITRAVERRPFIHLMKLLFLFLFYFSITAAAQNHSVITVRAGEDLNVLRQHLYYYPDFIPGKVYFIRDSARSVFNY